MLCLLKTGDEQFGDVAEKLTQIVDKGLLDEELPQTVDKRLTVDEGLESDGGKVYCYTQSVIKI